MYTIVSAGPYAGMHGWDDSHHEFHLGIFPWDENSETQRFE